MGGGAGIGDPGGEEGGVGDLCRLPAWYKEELDLFCPRKEGFFFPFKLGVFGLFCSHVFSCLPEKKKYGAVGVIWVLKGG